MPDIPGWRGRIGIAVPSTNTIAQPEMELLRPEGVTNHVGRIPTPAMRITSDADFVTLVEEIISNTAEALVTLTDCRPDHMVLAITAVSVWGGYDHANARIERLAARCGIGLTSGASALASRLQELRLKRVGLLTPYQPVMDDAVCDYLAAGGVEVARVAGLRCPSPHAIAGVSAARLREVLAEADNDSLEGWVQVGTNLPFARLVPEFEQTLGKPVIAVNPETYTCALAAIGCTNGGSTKRPAIS